MSKVQICNRALSTYLGIGRINSLSESSAAAEQCSMHYNDTLQYLIEAHWWSFAVGRQVLAELENDRVGEWLYKYARPADALVVRWVNTPDVARYLMSSNQNPDVDRDITDEFIYCDVQYATCEFTKLITDTSKFPQYFSDAFSAALAGYIAMPLTEDLKRAQNAMTQADARLDRAIVKDEEQSPPMGARVKPDWLSLRGVN